MPERIEKEGNNPNCQHKYIYDNWVVMTSPPIHHKICVFCGQVVEEYTPYEFHGDYQQVFKEFHGK